MHSDMGFSTASVELLLVRLSIQILTLFTVLVSVTRRKSGLNNELEKAKGGTVIWLSSCEPTSSIHFE